MFQGEPFAKENHCEAIEALEESMKRYNLSALGYEWDKTNPKILLKPVGERGYIEPMLKNRQAVKSCYNKFLRILHSWSL